MAVSDREPWKREGDCVRCHTTVGFLDHIGARETPPEHVPPADVAPIGIACTACHAPHGARLDHALLRRVPIPAGLPIPAAWAQAPTSVCLSCHEDGASAVVVADGSPHAAIENGCIGCHRLPPEGVAVERGGSHGWRADPASCAAMGCHADGVPATIDLTTRARMIAYRAGGSRYDPAQPPHAQPVAFELVSPVEGFGELLRVANDRAAHVHGGRAAREWVEAAERQEARTRTPTPTPSP
jgi:hypothetical protein